MTTKEAVKIFQDKIETMEHGALCFDYGNDKDAFILAMRLLEKEPCEDCISRQKVLEIAKSSKSNWIDNSVLFKKVNELPPVTPKQKIGHWIGCDGNYICSCCKGDPLDFLEPEGLDGGSYMAIPMKYCPNCGIKMTETKE